MDDTEMMNAKDSDYEADIEEMIVSQVCYGEHFNDGIQKFMQAVQKVMRNNGYVFSSNWRREKKND